MSTTSGNEERGSYFIDQENAAEMARLLAQDRLLTQGMGGLLAERPNLVSIQSVLDLACGPGGWALDLAREYPQIEVYGVDISQRMIAYAQALAQSQGRRNAHFFIMDVTQPLDFPDASFDLINVRFMLGFLRASRWPDLFQECQRLLRPGGVFRVTESEMVGVSTSPGLERLATWFIEALWRTGQSFSCDGRRMATIAVVESHFRDSGYLFEGSSTRLLNYSYGTTFYAGMCEDWRMAYKLAQPFLVKTGVATQEEIDRAYSQMLQDLLSPSFRGIYDLHTFWGTKPL